MNDSFYDSDFNILMLIEEINGLSNTKYQENLCYESAPFIYMNGKCYYFARGLNSIIKNGELYMLYDICHIILKVNDIFYDACGIVYPSYEYKLDKAFKLDMNNPWDMEYINFIVANEHDDKYLLPVLFQIAKEADINVRKKQDKVRKLIKNE